MSVAVRRPASCGPVAAARLAGASRDRRPPAERGRVDAPTRRSSAGHLCPPGTDLSRAWPALGPVDRDRSSRLRDAIGGSVAGVIPPRWSVDRGRLSAKKTLAQPNAKRQQRLALRLA